MRWRVNFVAEVSHSLRQLGLQNCPVCGLTNSLSVGHLPTLLIDGGFPPGTGDHCVEKYSDDDLTFAIRIECGTCGYLMLFNAQRFRTADEKIIALEGDRAESEPGG
jgi:hypothetical protein